MTRVVTGAALVGLLQGVLVVLALGPLGLSPFSGGWFSYSGSTSSSVVFTTTPALAPRLGLPLLLAVVAGTAAAVAQWRGWLGSRPPAGAAVAGRVAVAGVLVAVAGHAVLPDGGVVVAFGPARSSGRTYADYAPFTQEHLSTTWTVAGAAVAVAAVLVVLAAVRERRPGSSRALLLVLLLGAAGVVVQLVLLDGLGLGALAGEVVALLLGVVALLRAGKLRPGRAPG